jgi:hypothetical protein
LQARWFDIQGPGKSAQAIFPGRDESKFVTQITESVRNQPAGERGFSSPYFSGQDQRTSVPMNGGGVEQSSALALVCKVKTNPTDHPFGHPADGGSHERWVPSFCEDQPVRFVFNQGKFDVRFNILGIYHTAE